MMSVDRDHRDRLVEAIDRYLHEELTAFQFDDAIFDIRDNTSDETVRRVVDFLWCFYDDCDDHKVVLDRDSWNCFQRLRVLLMSEATLECSKKHIWTFTQFVAALKIAAFAWAAYKTGIGQHLMIVAIPFGVISICLSHWRARLHQKASNWDASLHPFTSVSQLLWIGHSLPRFRKEKYPTRLASRRIRGNLGNLVGWFHTYPFWLLYSPAVLLVQLMPVTVPIRRVVT